MEISITKLIDNLSIWGITVKYTHDGENDTFQLYDGEVLDYETISFLDFVKHIEWKLKNLY